MPKKLGSLFFSLCFLAITIAPSISMLFDEKVNLIQWVDSADDEEKSQEKNFEKDVVLANPLIEPSIFIKTQDCNILKLHNFYYSKPHLNLVSPPPEPATV